MTNDYSDFLKYKREKSNVVSPERTGWRDERISMRHRQWGWNCPAIDIDFLMLEYDTGIASALVEFKHEKAQRIQVGHPSIQALKNLGDRANIPVFVCRYRDDFLYYFATPLNDAARVLLAQPTRFTEQQWMELLYRCRGRNMPDIENVLV